MSFITPLLNNSRVATGTTNLATPTPTPNNHSPSSQPDTVDLSSLGRALSKLGQVNTPGGGQDETSPYELPEEIQRLLEYIRNLQLQLRELQQQLAKAMANSSLSQEARQLELASVQANINALTGSLMSAMTQLFQELEMLGDN